MHTIVTMTDRNYFPVGAHLLRTRAVMAKYPMVCYGPNLTNEQQATLKEHDIEYREIPMKIWDGQMQFLKFALLGAHSTWNDYATFVDWDTFFVKDWYGSVFDTAEEWELGITYNPAMCETRCFRAWANGGVIFSWGTDWVPVLQEMVYAGGFGNKYYRDAFAQLEDSHRPPHKQFYRDNLRWWVDQVALSALVREGIEEKKVGKGQMHFQSRDGINVKLFHCATYNRLDALPSPGQTTCYIGHLKQAGRKALGL